MAADFNGGQINNTVTYVDTPRRPLIIPFLCWTMLVFRSTGSQPWCEAYKNLQSNRSALLGYERRECASSHVYFFQPPPAALLYPNHHFLTPCYHFLVRALTPPPSLHSSALFARIYHPPAASRCFWVAFLSRRQWMPAIPLATEATIFYFHLSLFSALCCYATAANSLWRGDSCQEEWAYKRTAN